MKQSLSELLIQEGLTTLKIRYDWKLGKLGLFAAKEWDGGTDWSRYNKDFFVESLLTDTGKYLNYQEVIQIFKKYDLFKYLIDIISLIKAGRHIGIDCYYYREKDIRFFSSMHSNACGLNNRSQAIRSGGMRFYAKNENEYEVVVDGLNLSRSMSFKNAAAEIPYGGSKIVVCSDPVDLEDMDQIGFLSYAVDRTRSFTGADMGFPPELADIMKERFTLNVASGPRGPIGPTGIPTAYGVYLAAKQAARFKLGSDSLKGLTAAVQGLGSCGLPLAEHYLGEGAKLIVSDPDERRVRQLMARYPGSDITCVDPDKICFAKADIFSPSAMGGVITRQNIPELKCSIIMGPANNQIKAVNQEEECELARLLDKKGILFQCEWWHNVGGVLAAWEEYVNQESASLKNIMTKIKKLCTENTWNNLKEAARKSITPTECAYANVERKIYQ
ncbi:MAG: Glu/Leu/Phe/Val dehydrogenase family protein [Desulfocucumaceae bacterium]